MKNFVNADSSCRFYFLGSIHRFYNESDNIVITKRNSFDEIKVLTIMLSIKDLGVFDNGI